MAPSSGSASSMRSSSRVTSAVASNRAATPMVFTTCSLTRNHGHATRSGDGASGRAMPVTAVSASPTSSA